jgi:small-conductance mechanosensitive channel
MVEEFGASMQELVNMIPAIEARLLATVIALFSVWLVRRLVLFVIIYRHLEDLHSRYQVRKTTGYIFALVALLLLVRIWFDGFQSIATLLGLFSAGLVIALRDMMIDMAGWLFIIWRRPFKVGDRVQIGEHAGDVIDIRMFQFTILEIGNWVDADQSTGRVIHIPNGHVFNKSQANYTQGFYYIWDEISVMLTFESNWERAKSILNTIAYRHTEHLSDLARAKLEKAADKYYIFYSKLTPIVYTSVKEYGIVLTIRYLSEPRRRRGNAQSIWEDILREFAACPDIGFAYPTQRFYNQHLEGPVRPGSLEPGSPEPASQRELGT